MKAEWKDLLTAALLIALSGIVLSLGILGLATLGRALGFAK